MFKEGQKVWCVLVGEGVVVELSDGAYPVKVKFKNGDVTAYTSRGYMYSNNINQSLFHHPVKIVQGESATKPSIDWSHVKSEYKWLSVDKDGSAFVYENEPEHGESNYWSTSSFTYFNVNGLVSYSRGTCDWEDALVKRPD